MVVALEESSRPPVVACHEQTSTDKQADSSDLQPQDEWVSGVQTATQSHQGKAGFHFVM